MGKWTAGDIPNLENKIAIITGGNTGLGHQIALELARKNATIIIACRTREKGWIAIGNIEKKLERKIKADVIELDLTRIDSIRQFVIRFQEQYKQLDILVNNAGVVSLETRQESVAGIEMHMATNHLGHFALTGLLLPQIKQTAGARVVTMSSGGYLFADLDFDDMNWEKREYQRVKCYGASKLANLLFMVQLDRLFKQHHYDAISVAAHPGLSASEGQEKRAKGILSKVMAQPVEMGALPALMGATASDVKGSMYFGPRWGISGYPVSTKLKSVVYEQVTANQLWTYSEQMTGVKYQL